MKSSALDEGIRQELVRLRSQFVDETASPEEGLAAWRVLLDRAGGFQGLHEIQLCDLEDLIGWGWALAMELELYSEATRLLEAVFRHPEFDITGPLDRFWMLEYALTLLFAGEMEKAVTLFRSELEFLDARPVPSRGAYGCILYPLKHYCQAQPDTNSPPQSLTQLIYDVVYRRSVIVRQTAPRYEPREGASYAELLALLAMGAKRD
jgi:hypothetical protein